MIKYRDLEVIHTVQWPFNHFKLKEKDYINEQIAKEKFRKKEFFIQVYFENDERVLCISFEINFIRVVIYKNQGPYYEYGFDLVDNNYKKIRLNSMRERNIDYKINENGYIYIIECISHAMDTRDSKKKYNGDLITNVGVNFNEYDELLEWIEKFNIESILEEVK